MKYQEQNESRAPKTYRSCYKTCNKFLSCFFVNIFYTYSSHNNTSSVLLWAFSTREIQFFCLVLKLIWDMTIPLNIIKQPTYPRKEILSVPNNAPPMALNTDSVDSTIAAKVGSARLCATI